MQFRRVLVPVDYSESSESVVRYAVNLVRESEGEVILLHVVEPCPPSNPTYVGPSGSYDLHRHMLADAHAYLDEFTPALQGVAHRALIRLGDPAEEILAVATAETADLVVLATHGRRGLNRLIMGSTTETVLRKSAVPVLTLRTANLVPDKVATTRGQATL